MHKKVSAFLIVGGICFVFVFMGYNTFGPLGSGYAARVNNKVISILDFRNAVNRLQSFYSQMLGGNFDMNNERLMQIRSSALDQLITQEATAQAAVDEGLIAVPAQIRDTIVGISAFQEDGNFQRAYYNNYLQSQRITAAQFEERIARDISFQRAQALVSSSIRLTKEEIQKEWKARETKVNIEFAAIDREQLSQSFKVPQSEIDKFYDSEENLKSAENFYEVNQDRFTTDEQVKASHILIKFQKGNSDSESAALEKITAIQSRLTNESFEDVAKEVSEDPGSKSKGGSLGFFSRGRMVPEFEDYSFTGEIGVVSKPVKTDFGYHLIRVDERKEKTTQEFASVKNTIAKELLAETQIDSLIESLNQDLKSGNQDAISKTLSRLGVFWEETGEFDLSTARIPKIGNSDQILAAAVGLTKPGSFHDELVLDGRRRYAVRLIKREEPKTDMPPNPKEFEQEITQARARETFGKWSEQVVENSRIEKNEAILQ